MQRWEEGGGNQSRAGTSGDAMWQDSYLRMEGPRRQVGCKKGPQGCRQHYRSRKGETVCLWVLGARREAGGGVKEGCSERVAFEAGLDKWELGVPWGWSRQSAWRHARLEGTPAGRDLPQPPTAPHAGPALCAVCRPLKRPCPCPAPLANPKPSSQKALQLHPPRPLWAPGTASLQQAD